MIISTTHQIQGRDIESYEGLVSGEAIVGAHVFKDFFAGLRDFFGGRSGGYEKTLKEARDAALDDLVEEAQALAGVNGVVGIVINTQVIGAKGSMIAVTATGTAVKLTVNKASIRSVPNEKEA